ncbi:MAG: hypothetical protein GY950_26935, partial [bacterium]|nr:hypothetical protein [bacterium]
MRKSILFVCIIFLLVFFSSQVLTGSNLKLLRIHVATDSKKVLLFNMDDLNQILSDADAGGVSGNLEFADLSGTILATLGKIKNGKVKWSGKAKGTSLQVKFKKEVYPAVREKINPK